MTKTQTPDTMVFVVKATVHRALPLEAPDAMTGAAHIRSQCDGTLIGSQLGGRRTVRRLQTVTAGHLCERCFPE